nr:ulp1 protease family, C-terminal catalytic domain-containing protein [Tanacetum cinerariifolium]
GDFGRIICDFTRIICDFTRIICGLVKHKKNSSMGNEVFQPNLSRNTKSSVKRLSKGAPVKFNVGKWKRFVEDKEVEADVEGNESEADESKKANEKENVYKPKKVYKKKKQVSESSSSYEAEVVSYDKGVVSKAKKRKFVCDSSEEENVSKPKKVYKKKKQVSESSSSYEDEKPLKIKNKRSKKSKNSIFVIVPPTVPPTDKKPISIVSPQTPQRVVTRSSPTKSIVKPPTYLSSPYMNKRTKVTSLIKRLEFVLGNSLFAMQGDKYETVFQTRAGHDLSSVRLNMETLAPGLWIDANVIDCWTKAIIEGTIDEEQQWKVFQDEISTQFKHDVSSISLSEVDSVSMLRRMRFKIATKIVLHTFNVHAEKMFELAFKFESVNEEQRRISIIINAIKNRDERDPAKTNTFVKNHEDDAFKNK